MARARPSGLAIDPSAIKSRNSDRQRKSARTFEKHSSPLLLFQTTIAHWVGAIACFDMGIFT